MDDFFDAFRLMWQLYDAPRVGVLADDISYRSMDDLHKATLLGDFYTCRELLDKGADINKPVSDPNEVTALHLAARGKHYAILGLLLESGANIDAQDARGMTPLHYAISKRSLELVELLLIRGANPNLKEVAYGVTPLIEATLLEDYECVTTILCLAQAPVDINAKMNDGDTALHIAAAKGDYNSAEALLTCGAYYNVINESTRTTPLDVSKHKARFLLSKIDEMFIAARKGKFELVERHVRQCYKVNARDSTDGKCLLHYAVENLQTSLLECLIKADAITCFRDKGGFTPLDLLLTKERNSCDARKLLLYEVEQSRLHFYDKILDCELTDWWRMVSKSDRGLALRGVMFSDTKKMGRLGVRRGEGGPKFGQFRQILVMDSKTTVKEDSLLHLVAKSKWTEEEKVKFAKLLIKLGAIYNSTNKQGLKPIDLSSGKLRSYLTLIDEFFTKAKSGDNQQVRRILNDNPTVVNARDDDGGGTALYWSIANKRTDVVMTLLEFKADVKLVTKKWNTVLHIASSKGESKILEALIKSYPFKDKSAFVNFRSVGGSSPLHVAANVEVARILLRYGAICSRENSEGRAPYDTVEDEEVKKVLLSMKNRENWSFRTSEKSHEDNLTFRNLIHFCTLDKTYYR